MQNTKISVVMSVFNGDRFLVEAMESILGQTFQDFEFIIIDDASTDRTSQILADFASKDQRIVLVKNESNLGLTRSLNIGLRKATGEYIARMDADDISIPNRLEEQVEYLDSNPDIFLLGSNYHKINSKGKIFESSRVFKSHEEIRQEIVSGNCFCHGSVMFRRSCLETVGYYREKLRYAQDYDYWQRISERHRVANLSQHLYKVRKHPGMISLRKLEDQLFCHLLIVELAKERATRGQDILEELDLENIPDILINKYRYQKMDIEEFKLGFYKKYYKEAQGRADFVSMLVLNVKIWRSQSMSRLLARTAT